MATTEPRKQHAWPHLAVPSPTPSITVPASDNPDLLEINLGPNHPSTHGVLRLVVHLDGEIVVGLRNELGYVHTGIEKNIEQKTYWKAITYVPRMDYLSFFSGEVAFCMAVEKLLELEVPRRGEYLRVIFQELTRLHSHLIFLGTGSVDLGGIALLFYCFRDRDYVLDLFEMVTGQRMHPRYGQVGGVAEDVPRGFDRKARQTIAYLRGRLDEYEDLIGQNPIWRQRTVGVGVMPPDFAIQMAQSGPNVRASGIPWDLRTANGGYGAYRELGYQPVLGQNGDVFDRFWVRIQEMRASLDLIEKCLDGLPEGPHISDDRKVVLPPRHELHTSMESLIHHFKIVTEGYRVPPGEVYVPIESARGEFGFYMISDGSAKPWRARLRPPSFVTLSALAALATGHYLADLIAILASIDPVMGGLRPLMAADTLYDAIQAEIAKYPDRRSAILAALRLAQEKYRWLSPEAFEEVARCIDLPVAQCQAVASFYDMFFLEPVGRHVVEVCTNVSCCLVGATDVVAAFETELGCKLGETSPDGAATLRSVECLGGCGWGPVVSVDHRYLEHFTPDDARTVVAELRSGGGGH